MLVLINRDFSALSNAIKSDETKMIRYPYTLSSHSQTSIQELLSDVTPARKTRNFPFCYYDNPHNDEGKIHLLYRTGENPGEGKRETPYSSKESVRPSLNLDTASSLSRAARCVG
jgi:hypothetical protein